MKPQNIKPFLWLESRAEEAAALYCSLFPDSAITKLTHYSAGGPGPAGSVMTVAFRLAGIEFIAFNGGPHFRLNEAFSLSVECATQAEIDHLWEALGEGGKPLSCGWLTDRFGLTWQIIPEQLPRWLGGGDAEQAQRVMAVMLPMTKLDCAALQRAADGT